MSLAVLLFDSFRLDATCRLHDGYIDKLSRHPAV